MPGFMCTATIKLRCDRIHRLSSQAGRHGHYKVHKTSSRSARRTRAVDNWNKLERQLERLGMGAVNVCHDEHS
jgi:hypothetical protein